MKITDVTVTLWEWKDIPPARYTLTVHSSKKGSAKMGLVRISTDEGVEGFGFIGSSMHKAERDAPYVVGSLKPMLMGQNPLDREKLWQTMMKRTLGQRMTTISAVDVALWDLAGKHAGMPIHQMLGSYRDSIPAYASSMVLDTPEEYGEEAVKYRDAGWAAYKIHPHGDPDMDIRICREVRRAVGDNFRIMLDSTWSYDYPQAVRVGVAIQDLGYYWYEDPLPHDDIYGYVKLKQQLHIPIMATELPLTGPTAYAPWIMEQATDYLRGDVYLKGGLTSCLKTAHLAEAFHMTYEIHHGSNSLNNVANLHLAMAISNCEFFEVLLPSEAQKHGLLKDIDIDENGMIHAFNGPGLGVEIDFDLIERNKVEVFS